MNDPQPELFITVNGLGQFRYEPINVELGRGDIKPCLQMTPVEPMPMVREPNPKPSPFGVAMQISNRVAAVKWTADQQKQVDAAIVTVAHRQRYFTADDIWAELGAGFPVTKGLAGRLNAAVRRKMICNTGQISHANRGGAHDHAQRLTVWSLYGV